MATSLEHADRFARPARSGRRRIAAIEPRRVARCVSEGKARHRQTVFGIAALLAPVVGPTLGGYITDNYGWRWIFYLNVPVGLLALVMCRAVVSDPAYLKAAAAPKCANSNRRFDTLGLCLLSRHDDFLGSRAEQRTGVGLVRRSVFSRADTGCCYSCLVLVGLIVRETADRQSADQFSHAARPKLSVCCIIIFCAFGVLYANTVALPALLQSLFGYDATTSGLVLSPAGIFAIIVLVIVGRVLRAESMRAISWRRVSSSSASEVTGCRA